MSTINMDAVVTELHKRTGRAAGQLFYPAARSLARQGKAAA